LNRKSWKRQDFTPSRKPQRTAGSVYELVLAYEPEHRGLLTTRQQPVPWCIRLVNHGVHIEVGFRADLIVEDLVIVEIKSVEVVAPVHKKQLLTHLRLAKQAFGPTHKLQRGPDQGRHHARC